MQDKLQVASWKICGCVLVAFAACAGVEDIEPISEVPASPTDAGVTVDAGATLPTAHLELGVGAAAFSMIEDGGRVGLTRGPQGLQHVWVAARIRDMDPERVIVELSLSRQSDGALVSEGYRVRLPFQTHTGYAERVGMQLVVLSPDDIVDRYAILTGRAINSEGVRAEATTRVLVQWE